MNGTIVCTDVDCCGMCSSSEITADLTEMLSSAFSNLCTRKSPKRKANLSQLSLVSVQNCDKRGERASLFFETGRISGALC